VCVCVSGCKVHDQRSVPMCVCVCVCERERERERESVCLSVYIYTMYNHYI